MTGSQPAAAEAPSSAKPPAVQAEPSTHATSTTPPPTAEQQQQQQQQSAPHQQRQGSAQLDEQRRQLEDARRAMALKRYDSASDLLATLLESMRESSGEDAPQLVPVLHRYGRALLEHAIQNSAALGGGGTGGAAGTTAEAGSSARRGAKSGEGSTSAAAASDPRFSFGGDAPSDDEEADGADVGNGKKRGTRRRGAQSGDQAEGAEGEEGKRGGEGADDDGGEGQGGDDDDEDDDEGEDEDEDELGLAFSVLELARVQYEKLLRASGDEARLETLDGARWGAPQIRAEVAEVYNDLGDLGLESENFQQATSDYESSLRLLLPLLQPHSRRLADAYLRLGLALEFHPDETRRGEAAKYVEGASSVLARRAEALAARRRVLQKAKELGAPELAKATAAAVEAIEESVVRPRPTAEGRGTPAAAAASSPEGEGEGEGEGENKGKERESTAPRLERDDVAEMDEAGVSREDRDVAEMREELSLKLEEYRQASQAGDDGAGVGASNSSTTVGAALGGGGGGGGGHAAKAALQQAINEALLGASTNGSVGDAVAAGASSSPFGTRTGGDATTAGGTAAQVNDLSATVRRKKRAAAGGEEETGGVGGAGRVGEAKADGKGKGKSKGESAGDEARDESETDRAKRARVGE